MAVDPEIREMLDRLQDQRVGQSFPPPLHEYRELYRQRYLSMSKPSQAAVEHGALPLPGGQASLHLYRPTQGAATKGVILYLHGGGFILGDATTYSKQSARLASECQAVVVFVEYRLAPEHPFPAAREDTIAAVNWIVENAAAIDADPARIALMGDSAGGNLAIGAMLHFRAENLFKCAVLLYPVVDFRPYRNESARSESDIEFETGFYLELRAMEFFAGAYLPDAMTAADPRVSPLLEPDLSGLPPVMMYSGESDLLRDQGRAFVERLASAGNRVSYRRFDGLIHNFMQHTGVSRCADHAFLQVCHATRRALTCQAELSKPAISRR